MVGIPGEGLFFPSRKGGTWGRVNVSTVHTYLSDELLNHQLDIFSADHCLILRLLGEMIPFDSHLQMGRNHQQPSLLNLPLVHFTTDGPVLDKTTGHPLLFLVVFPSADLSFGVLDLATQPLAKVPKEKNLKVKQLKIYTQLF